MALYVPHSIFHLARLLCVRPENFGPYYVIVYDARYINCQKLRICRKYWCGDYKAARLEVLDMVFFVCGKYYISIMSWYEGVMLFIAVPSSGPAVWPAVQSRVTVTKEECS